MRGRRQALRIMAQGGRTGAQIGQFGPRGARIRLVVARGPAIVSKAGLVFDASVDQPAEKTAKHTQLAVAGVVPRDTA